MAGEILFVMALLEFFVRYYKKNLRCLEWASPGDVSQDFKGSVGGEAKLSLTPPSPNRIYLNLHMIS